MGCDKVLGFYLKWDGKPLAGFGEGMLRDPVYLCKRSFWFLEGEQTVGVP